MAKPIDKCSTKYCRDEAVTNGLCEKHGLNGKRTPSPVLAAGGDIKAVIDQIDHKIDELQELRMHLLKAQELMK